jgi:hypothetical protein
MKKILKGKITHRDSGAFPLLVHKELNKLWSHYVKVTIEIDRKKEKQYNEIHRA